MDGLVFQFEGEEIPYKFGLQSLLSGGLAFQSDGIVDARFWFEGTAGVLSVSGFHLPVSLVGITNKDSCALVLGLNDVKPCTYAELAQLNAVVLPYQVGSSSFSFEDVRVFDGIVSFKLSCKRLYDKVGRKLSGSRVYKDICYLFCCNLYSRMFSVMDLGAMQEVVAGLRGLSQGDYLYYEGKDGG